MLNNDKKKDRYPKKGAFQPLNDERIKVLKEFQDQIGIQFNQLELLNQALVHSSYFLYKDKKDNQRLEFLGDACLALVVTEFLYNAYPQLSEGQLSKAKNFIVSEKVLYQQALNYKLGSCLLMSPGELKNRGNEKSGALSDAFEALIGAMYLDTSYETVKNFLLSFIENEAELYFKKQSEAIDYKSELQYLVQKKYKTYPIYKLLSETGPNHNKEFTMEISIMGKHHFAAIGKTKKEAEQKAAEYIYKQVQRGLIKL